MALINVHGAIRGYLADAWKGSDQRGETTSCPRVRRSTSSRPRFTDSLVVPFSGQAEMGWGWVSGGKPEIPWEKPN